MSAAKSTPGPNLISGGAPVGTPTCPSCPHQIPDKKHPGWGWCGHPRNRVYAEGWANGFTPSLSPSGSCELHPERAALAKAGSDGMPSVVEAADVGSNSKQENDRGA